MQVLPAQIPVGPFIAATSSSTVRFQVNNIRKLGVANRTEAAALAVRRHVVN